MLARDQLGQILALLRIRTVAPQLVDAQVGVLGTTAPPTPSRG